MNKLENFEYIGYDYKEISVKKKAVALYIDGYYNLGWIVDKTRVDHPNAICMYLKFKRNRKIANKVELLRLERQFEGNVKEIHRLEQAKTLCASMFAYCIGSIGTIFMALSTFSFLNGNFMFCMIFAIPAFLGWMISYPVYSIMKKRKVLSLTPLIDEQYDCIDNICQKANAFIMK